MDRPGHRSGAPSWAPQPPKFGPTLANPIGAKTARSPPLAPYELRPAPAHGVVAPRLAEENEGKDGDTGNAAATRLHGELLTTEE
jgi:hypothetical protein